MDHSTIVLIPLLVFGVVLAFAFAGCGTLLDTSAPDSPPEKKPEPEPTPTPTPTPTPGPTTTPEPPDAYPKLVLSLGGSNGRLRSYWRLAEAVAAQDAADSELVNPRPGKYKGNVALNAEGVLRQGSDPNDTAAQFDGTTAYVECAFDPLLNPVDAFTVEAWVRPELTQAGTAVVVSSYEPKQGRGFVLDIKRDAAGTMTARIRVGNNATFRALEADLGGGTTHDGWRHLVATFTKTGTASELKLYVNAATVTDPVFLNYEIARAPATFRIGGGQDESTMTPPGPAAAFFPGRIDEVALYDVGLDGGKVADHFLQATKK